MKQGIVLFMMLLMFSVNLVAQNASDIILHGYSREISGGAMQSSENNVHGNKKPSYHYFIYLQTQYGAAPVVSAFFLNGEYYTARLQKVKTPVVISSPDFGDKEVNHTLVRRTASTVYQLIPLRDGANLPPSVAAKKQADTNEVYITGVVRGKSFTIAQKKLKTLPPLFAP
jgi:hypothetical protein